MPEWLSLCLSRRVARRAAYSSVVVGAVLIAINHGDALLHGQFDPGRVLRMLLTVLVPYVVSTVSSVSSIMELRQRPADANPETKAH